MEATLSTAVLAPRLAPLDFDIFKPRHAARVLGIDADSVNRYLKLRPKLFPQRAGKWHQWTRDEFAHVLRVLRVLSPKASKAQPALA